MTSTERSNEKIKALRRTVLADLTDYRHGTRACALSWRCSCDICKAYREQYKIDLKDANHPDHGTVSAWKHGACRCSKCRNAFYNSPTYKIRREIDWKRIGIKNFKWNDFTQLLKDQTFRCPVCNCRIDHHGELDHNHKTGKVRGIICESCNVNVGIIENAVRKSNLPIEDIVKIVTYIC